MVAWLKEYQKKLDFHKLLDVAQKNLGNNFSEQKKTLYVKVNKGSFQKNQAWVDFVLSLLIYQIKENISDLHIEALNNIKWDIKYRKNKMLEILTYEELRDTLFEVIDYIYQDESEQLKNTKKEFYDTFLWPINEISLFYDKQQFKDQVDLTTIKNETDQKIYDDISEKKMKLLFINKINEALGSLYGFASQVRNMDSNVVVWYWKDSDVVIPEYSFRIAGKQQDIEIDGAKFFTVVQRLMLTEFFPLDKLWIGDYEAFVRSMLLAKKLNIIAWETNSGKTTTILSLLSETSNAFGWKIKLYSFEDPIEKPVDFISQTQAQKNLLNEEWNYWADDAERFFLRGDPDGVLIWEIRDKNTAWIALKLASSWHYCYATLHCDNVLSVIPRFAGWWLDVKNNITALWFVEVTQLITTFKLEQYLANAPIEEKVESWVINIEDLKEIPYEKFKAFNAYKQWIIKKEEANLTEKEFELFGFMVGRSFLINIYKYFHTGDIGVMFPIQTLYLKYLKYLSTYFTNRFVDWDDFLWKKQYIIPFIKALHIALKDKQFEKDIINPDIDSTMLWKLWKIINTKALEHLTDEEMNLLKEGKDILQAFLTDKYQSKSGVKVPFTFRWFLKVIYEYWFLPFAIKSKGVVPMVEFFDYSNDYRSVLDQNYEHLFYNNKTFTPMFLYAYLTNQKTVAWGKCIDFFSVVSMFSVEYELN